MPRFFFDYDSGSNDTTMRTSSSRRSMNAVHDELRRTLPAVLRDEQGQRRKARIISTIRNSDGHVVLIGRIAIEPPKRAA